VDIPKVSTPRSLAARHQGVHVDVVSLAGPGHGVAGKPPVPGELGLRLEHPVHLANALKVRQEPFGFKPPLQLFEHVPHRPVARVLQVSRILRVRLPDLDWDGGRLRVRCV